MKINLSVCTAFVLLTSGMLLTTGCPVGIEYPPGTPGTEKIDARLLGTWGALQDTADMLKILVAKKDDFSYQIEVLETGEGYLVEETVFTAWVTNLEGRTFIYSKPVESSEDGYYLYHYEFDSKGELVIHDVGLLVNGQDGITSTETFRAEISASLKNSECLSGRFSYQKE
jgi:hypothetical protein